MSRVAEERREEPKGWPRVTLGEVCPLGPGPPSPLRQHVQHGHNVTERDGPQSAASGNSLSNVSNEVDTFGSNFDGAGESKSTPSANSLFSKQPSL